MPQAQQIDTILKETQLSRDINLNDTNIALLLQEATQKYRILLSPSAHPLAYRDLRSLQPFQWQMLHSAWTQCVITQNFKRYKRSFVPLHRKPCLQ